MVMPIRPRPRPLRFRKTRENFVTHPAPYPALREMRTHLSHPATLAALAGIAAILGLVGSFDTDELLRLGPRTVYWLVLVVATYSVGVLSAALLWPRLRHHLPRWPLLGVIGFFTGIGVMLVVLAVNAATFGHVPEMGEMPEFAGTIIAIALIVTVVLDLFEGPGGRQEVAPAPAPILERLPLHKRGPLVALSVEDHYVRIRTTKGEEMVLLRLSDAIREVGKTRGLRVHRSHWIALDQVRAAAREGDRARLTMRHGDDIPVSRANLPAIREAGLLPR